MCQLSIMFPIDVDHPKVLPNIFITSGTGSGGISLANKPVLQDKPIGIYISRNILLLGLYGIATYMATYTYGNNQLQSTNKVKEHICKIRIIINKKGIQLLK